MPLQIIKNTFTHVVLKASSNVSETSNIQLANLALSTETFDAPNAVVAIDELQWSCTAAGSGEVSRLDGANEAGEIPFAGNGSLKFVGYTDNTFAGSDVRIKTDNAVLYLSLKKVAGFIPPDRQSLQPRDR